MKNSAHEELQEAAQSVVLAVMSIDKHADVMRRFLKECQDMENFGAVVNPTLYRDPERRAVSALMEPIFRSALDFSDTYKKHCEKASDALRKVKK